MRQIAFEVDTSPPTKSEALSIFNVKHAHHSRIQPLLEAARRALAGAEWDPDTGKDLAIEVVVHGARLASDATNILGGLGDVLERKSHRPLSDVLGDLAEVHLFANDRQIHKIAYRWIAGERDYYSLSLTELE